MREIGIRRSANALGLSPRAADAYSPAQRFVAAPGVTCYRLRMASARDLLSRIKSVARTLAATVRVWRPAMIGALPSQRPPWHDPAAHARDFAERYFVPLDQYTTIRLEELGVPRNRIGSSDHDHGIEWCSFNPHEDTGGGVGAEGRSTLIPASSIPTC